MAACDYARWDAAARGPCAAAAGHLARTPDERRLCDVHARVAYALGWPIHPVDWSGIPELEEAYEPDPRR